jgi:hypothetical protein
MTSDDADADTDADADGEEIVVVGTRRSCSAGTGNRVYHTDVETCQSAPAEANRSEARRAAVEAWGYEECAYCAGEFALESAAEGVTGDDRRTALRHALVDPEHPIHDTDLVEDDPEAFADD